VFYAPYRDGNEAVRLRHFPARATLFDESFDAYPETADPVEFGAAEMARIAARILAVQTREIRRLEAEIRIRDGRLAWEQGDPESALDCFRRAVAHLPDHAEASRTLAEFLHRLEWTGEAAEHARLAAELRPDNAEYWHFLGVVLRSGGDLAGAATAQERALDIAPDHHPSRQTLDAIRAQLAETRAAS
jgi:tetratricopeptide (TPR) repeat protein